VGTEWYPPGYGCLPRRVLACPCLDYLAHDNGVNSISTDACPVQSGSDCNPAEFDGGHRGELAHQPALGSPGSPDDDYFFLAVHFCSLACGRR
jgi:hypothetical protein